MRNGVLWAAAAAVAILVTVVPAHADATRTGPQQVAAGVLQLPRALRLEQVARPRGLAPKLEYGLGVLASGRAAPGSENRRFAPLTATKGSNVRVILETRGGVALRRALVAAGARFEGRAGRLVQALVPVRALASVSRLRGVTFVRMPARLEPDAIPGEEVRASNVSASLARRWTGAGVKVAIFDGGFRGYEERVAEGELPGSLTAKDFCGGDFTTYTDHGTAVAEIVHEMAPGAKLYLVCVDSEVSVARAERWAASAGIRIISHSANALDQGRGDGAPVPGTLPAVVAAARQHGILWVNSAGNYGERHWAGTFADANANGFHDFIPTNEGNGFVVGQDGGFCAYLRWDEWPAAVSDFDLLVADTAGQFVGASQTRQTGTQPPVEKVCLENRTGQAQTLFLVIGGVSVASAPRIDLFLAGATAALQYPVPDGSVGDPGTSPFALTVGAVCWRNHVLEPYSSRGPTIDGRIKPDIAGQDSNSGATYGKFTNAGCGRSGFPGTSAAAPAVAGAAAIVKQQNPGFSADRLQQYLERNAIDLGTPGKDTLYGAGRLFVPTPARQGPRIADRVRPVAKALPSSGRRGTSIRLYSQASDDSGEVRITDTIRTATRTLATLRTGFTRTLVGDRYYLLWRSPATITGVLRHCVRAFDRTGNESTVSCARLTITK